MEVTDSRGVEFIAAKWSQGGSLSLAILLAAHSLWDRKSSLKSRWTQTQTDKHTQKRDTFSHALKPFENFLPLTPDVLQTQFTY